MGDLVSESSLVAVYRVNNQAALLVQGDKMDYSQLNFALYARKSTEDSGKQVQSIPDQIKWMKDRAYTLDVKYKKKDIFQESKSAKTPGIRDEFNRLVNDIRAGKYNALLSWATNRLARNPQEAGIIQQLLQDGSLKCIITHEKAYYPEDNAVVFAVEMGINSQFIRDLMANVRRGMVSKAEKGWLPGIPPVGYKNDRETKTITIDDERYGLVRQMWDYMLLGCYTVADIARMADEELNLTTIPRKKRGGKPLSLASVYSMFHNPFYAGYVRYSGKVYNGNHTPMVTQSEFDKVQELIKTKDAPRPAVDEPDPFPYRGLIKCGECGCLITYSKTTRHYKNGNSKEFEYCYCTRKRKNYKCPNKISIKPEELTKLIREESAKYTIIEDFFQWAVKYLDEFDAEENVKQQEIYKSQVRAIERTENQLRELNRMRYRGQIDDSFYDNEKTDLENKLVILRGQFDDKERANKDHRRKLEEYFNFARYAQEDFESDDDYKKNKVLSIVGQNLLFKDGHLWFEPIPYLTPLMPKYKKLKERYDYVQTHKKQGWKQEVQAIIMDWYA